LSVIPFGGSILLNYLAEGSYRKPVRGLFLVSVPNWGPGGWAYDEFAVPDDVEARLPASRIFLLDSELTIITVLDALAADQGSAEWPDQELPTAQPRSSATPTRVSLALLTRQPNPR